MRRREVATSGHASRKRTKLDLLVFILREYMQRHQQLPGGRRHLPGDPLARMCPIEMNRNQFGIQMDGKNQLGSQPDGKNQLGSQPDGLKFLMTISMRVHAFMLMHQAGALLGVA
jgi:hypothetical protein